MRIEVNLNWSSRFREEDIAELAQAVEKAGVKKVWAGELDLFRKPEEVAGVVEEYTSLETGLIVRPARSIEKLAKKYDVCLIPGGRGLASLNSTLRCLSGLSRLSRFEVRDVKKIYVGCSGRIMAKKAFEMFKTLKIAPRIMPNYVKAEFVEWIAQNLEWEEILPIGPSLVLPSKMKDELLIAALLVAGSNRSFAENFGFEKLYRDVTSLDVKKMIAESKLEKNEVVERYERLLLDNFTVSGSVEEIAEKIRLLSRFDGFVLADPFFRDPKSLKLLKKLVVVLRT